MDVTFLTPIAAALALVAAVPLGVLLARERRTERVRVALGLARPSALSRLALVGALIAVPALLGIAATQPVVEVVRVRPERTDAQVFLVVDTSRSMLASAHSGAPTRFDRARDAALELRDRLPEVPIGVASLTDRVLPHLFPTTDRRVLAATLESSVAVERPPPALVYSTHATSLDALSAVPGRGYFAPSAVKRAVVVLTDGETRPVSSQLASAFDGKPRVGAVFVRLWEPEERIYETGVAEGGYRPDPASGAALAEAAALVGAPVLAESEVSAAASAVRDLLGEGPTAERRQEGGRFALMPFVSLAAIFPLGFVLLRRNL